jgi:hypothetical protein
MWFRATLEVVETSVNIFEYTLEVNIFGKLPVSTKINFKLID